MIHMTGGRTCRCARTVLPIRRWRQRSAARRSVEKRAGFRFLLHRSFSILMGRCGSTYLSWYGFL